MIIQYKKIDSLNLFELDTENDFANMPPIDCCIYLVDEVFGTTNIYLNNVEIWNNDCDYNLTKDIICKGFKNYFLSKIDIRVADITTLTDVNCIVNAAKCSLQGGGGIDGAIHRAAGPALKLFCSQAYPNGIETGEAVLTPAFKISDNTPIKYIIHTVAPIYEDGMHQEALAMEDCYYNCLDVIHAYDLKTIALCSLGTGIYGNPLKESTEIAFNVVKDQLINNNLNIDKVVFCCFSPEIKAVYDQVLAKLLENNF